MTSSDAHRLDDFETTRSTYFYVAAPTLAEIVLACKGLNNRKVVIASKGTVFFNLISLLPARTGTISFDEQE